MPRLKSKEASGTGGVVGTDSELLWRRAAQDTWVSEGQRRLPVKKQSADRLEVEESPARAGKQGLETVPLSLPRSLLSRLPSSST